jgi:hypothetical protein
MLAHNARLSMGLGISRVVSDWCASYTFANQTTPRSTALGNGIVTDVTISPDMQKIAYTRALNPNAAFNGATARQRHHAHVLLPLGQSGPRRAMN